MSFLRILLIGGVGLAAYQFFRGTKEVEDLQLQGGSVDLKDFKLSNPIVNVYVKLYNPSVRDISAISIIGNLYYKGSNIAAIDQPFNSGSVFTARKATTWKAPVKVNLTTIAVQLLNLYRDWKSGTKIDKLLIAKGYVTYDKIKKIPFDTSIDVTTGETT
jgi:hypothetical protein